MLNFSGGSKKRNTRAARVRRKEAKLRKLEAQKALKQKEAMLDRKLKALRK